MRAIVSFSFCFSVFLVQAQKPFNYGQNRNVYFISSELRKNWDIDKVHLSRHEKAENAWILYSCSFSAKQIISRTYIRYGGKSFRFHLDSLTQPEYDMDNSYYFIFEKGKVREFGSSGSGAHEWHSVKRSSGASLIETSRRGGDISPNLNYTRNIFSSSGQLRHGIYYPVVPDSVLLKFSYSDSLKAKGVNFLIRESLKRRKRPDTLRFQYNKKGQLIKAGDEVINPSDPVSFFLYNSDIEYGIYSEQAFVNSTRMETFILGKAGYLPRLILFEISPYCVISFYLDENTLQYYGGRSVNLEKMYTPG